MRAAARYIAPPLAEEGAAQLIEQLVLARRRRRGAGLGAAGRARGCGSRAGRAAAGHRVTPPIVPDDAAGYAEAARVLRAGGIVALPTDTVYGIGVALDAPGGIERLFAAKRRPPDKAIMLLLADAGPGADARAVAWPPAAAPSRRRSGRAA